MAFVDKITKMRRCALIHKGNGAIAYEGVEIEHNFLLKRVVCFGEQLLMIHKLEIEDFVSNEDLILVYQDKEQKKHWEPRLHCKGWRK